MGNGRVVTPYGTGKVIENPEDRDLGSFEVELDKEFTLGFNAEKKHTFLKSEFQFIENFAQLFIFDFSGRFSFDSKQLASFAQFVKSPKLPDLFTTDQPSNLAYFLAYFELDLKQKEFRIKIGKLPAKKFLHLYGWLDRVGLMHMKQFSLDEKVDQDYFQKLKKILPHTREGINLGLVLDLEKETIQDQWFLAQNGVFEVN